ncbi:type IV secretory system conjugative DNA transfer family protein [Corynebacterium dentalis]|uniref:type IV secretory system conjugative DNA transfer family protein n=1 Tax=Corynebacterium dentalis TaxID=2014528 RepID=UPI001356AA61|nr:TraM recognition domain-containing protein [Corynebacterium dentalis]
MSTSVRNRSDHLGMPYWAGPYLLGGVLVGLWLIFWAGQALSGPGVSVNPLLHLIGLLKPAHAQHYSILGFILSAVILAALGGLVLWLVRSSRARTSRGGSVRHATKSLASRAQIEQMGRKAVTQSQQHLNMDLPEWASPGQLVGRELGTGKEIYLDYETLMLDTWPARYGKTTGRVFPMMLDAPGAVVATSNKPDLIGDTIALREAIGTCWVGDPQRIYTGGDARPAFWVDPLDYIRRRPADEWDSAAGDLARLFADDAGVSVGSGGDDAMWRNSGAELLACMLLAAAVEYRPITDVLDWANDESDRSIVDILKRHDWPSMAMLANGSYNLVDRTRSGVFFSMKSMVTPLATKVFQNWVTRPQSDDVPKFSPDEFIAAHDRGECPTLYLLSDKRRAGSASLLVILLTVWVTEAAEYSAFRQGGRLKTPLMMPLDEIANTVTWQGMPDAYSHFGSKGIIIASILQSYGQAKEIWGENKAGVLRDNAALMIGGGIKDSAYLKEIETLIGEYESRKVSRSSDSDSYKTSASVSLDDKSILTAAELRDMDPHMMLVIAPKRRPVLVETIPFWERTFRPEIEAQRKLIEQAKQDAAALAAAEQ